MGMDIRNILKLLLNSTRCYFVLNVLKKENFNGKTPASINKGTAGCLKSEK